MKFLDFTSLFDGDPTNLAILSTFQLDADFFERRLLRCPALVKARRILVFMDAGQWFKLLRQDIPARFLNRRYLVVPVRPTHGVFHPKLNLLLTEHGGQVQCGSNNLTRSGCSSNLELLNAFTIDLAGDSDEAIRLAQESLAFFKRACDDADKETGRIAREWLEESSEAAPWLPASLPPRNNRKVRLVHTYEGSLWDRIAALVDKSPPQKLLVISPFHDLDGGMVRRVHQRWPKCRIEIVVQQKTTNLPVSPLKKLHAKVSLSELRNSSRRLHAKLLAWESAIGTGCLVGSANFTTAAFDARNVETCLLVTRADDIVHTLFDKDLGTRPIPFDDFEPGTEKEPEAVDPESTSICLTSAILTVDGELRVTYRHRLHFKPENMRLAIRTPGEKHPRAFLNVPNRENGSATVLPPETALTDAHGTILASLIAEVDDQREESAPIWVVQEARLTYEPSGEGSSSVKSKVEDTGEGLTEFLEELGKRDGIAAVIEHLRHLNIRFNDGDGGFPGKRKFRLRVHDPFHPDLAPDWLLNAKANKMSLAEAIYEFVDRHEKQRLRRHVKRGNINGTENFLDIFTALVRLLYVYHVRGVVNRYQLIGRICQYLEVATSDAEENEYRDGYLYRLFENLDHDSRYLQEVINELNFLGHLRAALVIVQKVRFVPGEKAPWGTPQRPSDCLPHKKEEIKDTVKELGLEEPSRQEVIKALKEYNMFTTAELADLEREIIP